MTTGTNFKRFAVSGLHDHQPEPPNTIAVGSYDEAMSNIPGTLQQAEAMKRAEEILGRAQATEAEQAIVRAGQAAILNDIIDGLSRRVDAYVQRREAQARQDAEEAECKEQERIRAELDALPDPDNPEFAPGGLTPTGPTEPEHERRLAAMGREAEHERSAVGQGDDVIEDNRVVAPDEVYDQRALPPELARPAPPDPGTEPLESMRLKDPARYGYAQDPPEATQTPIGVEGD